MIEDDPLTQQVFSATLAGACELVQVETLAQGLTFLRERIGEVYAVLLDLLLPNGEGVAVINQLRLSFPKVPIVVVTGIPASEIHDEQLLAAGVQEVVRKPNLNAGILLSAMAHAIARTQYERSCQPLREAITETVERAADLREVANKLDLGKRNG